MSVSVKEAIGVHHSTMVVRNLLRLSLSTISYLRSFFPDYCFVEKRASGGLRLHSLVGATQESRIMIDWLEKGVFDAFDRGYLRIFTLCVFEGATEDPHGLVEAYDFTIEYTADGSGAALHTTSYGHDTTIGAVRDDTRSSGVCLSKEDAIREMGTTMRRLITLTESLPYLPQEHLLTMRLAYYEDRTPPDYEPPYFAPLDTASGASGSQDTPLETTPLSSFRTRFHGVAMKFRTMVSPCTHSSRITGRERVQEPENVHPTVDENSLTETVERIFQHWWQSQQQGEGNTSPRLAARSILSALHEFVRTHAPPFYARRMDIPIMLETLMVCVANFPRVAISTVLEVVGAAHQRPTWEQNNANASATRTPNSRFNTTDVDLQSSDNDDDDERTPPRCVDTQDDADPLGKTHQVPKYHYYCSEGNSTASRDHRALKQQVTLAIKFLVEQGILTFPERLNRSTGLGPSSVTAGFGSSGIKSSFLLDVSMHSSVVQIQPEHCTAPYHYDTQEANNRRLRFQNLFTRILASEVSETRSRPSFARLCVHMRVHYELVQQIRRPTSQAPPPSGVEFHTPNTREGSTERPLTTRNSGNSQFSNQKATSLWNDGSTQRDDMVNAAEPTFHGAKHDAVHSSSPFRSPAANGRDSELKTPLSEVVRSSCTLQVKELQRLDVKDSQKDGEGHVRTLHRKRSTEHQGSHVSLLQIPKQSRLSKIAEPLERNTKRPRR